MPHSGNPFSSFVAQADALLTLSDPTNPAIPASDRQSFQDHRQRIQFLSDLVARVDVLRFAFDRLSSLTSKLRRLRNITPWTQEADDAATALEADTLLIYYEAKSVVDMIGQLGIPLDPRSEIHYLCKVRDRFLSHMSLARIVRGTNQVWHFRDAEPSFPQLGVVRTGGWGPLDAIAFGKSPAAPGTPEWNQRRQSNEALVRSETWNEKFAPSQIQDLKIYGVRDCDTETALNELSTILSKQILPMVRSATEAGVNRWGYRR